MGDFFRGLLTGWNRWNAPSEQNINIDKILDNRKNEFNVNSVNISSRCSDEKDSFLGYYNGLKEDM